MQNFLRDCQDAGVDPFNLDVDSIVPDSVLENFDRVMSEKAVDIEGENSESDSEDAVQAIPLRTNAIKDVKTRKVGLWKREYAEALAGSSSWKPCKVIGAPTKITSREAKSRCLLGTPLKSVILEREDDDNVGKQFTVNTSGRVFYLLRTPVCVELVHLTQIYHPKDHPETVWIEYYRVLANSAAIQVCDRADTNFQRFLSSDGTTISTASAGSKQLEIERAEREQQGKSELYHWGDVLCTSNAASLVGGVYWLTRADEKEWITDNQCKADVLKSVKDKFPITNLNSMDFVVVGSCFSDSN
jgi:hypothetical protein